MLAPFIQDSAVVAAPAPAVDALPVMVSLAPMTMSAPLTVNSPIRLEACAGFMRPGCGDAAIAAGYRALASCPTPSDGQFFLECDEDGDLRSLTLYCDRSDVPGAIQ